MLNRILLTVAVLVALLIGGGALYQWLQADADRASYPAPGRMIDVDGLSLHIDCRGEGEPTVILEAGLTSGSSSWGLVHDAIATTTRTCATIRDESLSFRHEVFDESPPVSLGDLPLFVISQGKPPAANEDFGVTLEMAEQQSAVWQILQKELAALSSESRRLIAHESGHVIQFEQPEMVIAAIADLVAIVRRE